MASSANASGWTVVLTGSQFSVTASVTASIATNYKVRYASGLTSQRLSTTSLAQQKAKLAARRQNTPRNAWGAPLTNANDPIPLDATRGQSATFDVVALSTPPSSPSDLATRTVTSTRIDLVWTDNANNESGHVVQRQVSGSSTWDDVATLGANVTAYADFGLNVSTPYRYRVRAVNSIGGSGWSNESLSTSGAATSPTQGYAGTDFAFVLPASGQGAGPGPQRRASLQIASTEGATVQVKIPYQEWKSTVVIPAGGTATVALPMPLNEISYDERTALPLAEYDGIESKSVNITSDTPVTVQMLRLTSYSSEMIAVLPKTCLGRVYFIVNYAIQPDRSGSMFAILAVENDTQVTITNTKTIGRFKAGIPCVVTLQAGESYQLRDFIGANDFTGSRVVSNKPIAVFSGAVAANIPAYTSAANPLTEQLLPTNLWRQDFYATGTPTRTASTIYRVIACSANARIYVNGTTATTLQRGQFYEFESTGPVAIGAEGVIQTYAYSKSSLADTVADSDPSMTTVQASANFASSYLFRASDDALYTGRYVNISVLTAKISTIRLNGIAVPASNFVYNYATPYSCAKVAVPPGRNLLTSTDGTKFGATLYGFGPDDCFSSPIGGELPDNNIAAYQPGTPTNLVATPVSDSQVNLTWNSNTHRDGFILERRLNVADAPWAMVANLPPDPTSYLDTGLTKLTGYVYRIRAFANLDTPYSNETTATTLDSKPQPPVLLNPQVLSQSEIKLNWYDQSDNETGFRIERKSGTGQWGSVGTRGAGVTSFTDTGLTKKTTYSYRVFAYNAIGDSDPSATVSGTTFDSVPNAPSNLSAIAPVYNRVDLTWTDNSDNEDDFRLEKSTNGVDFVQFATVPAGTTTYPDGGVSGATSYTYRVRARNNGGFSAYSNTFTLQTPNPPPPVAPTNLRAKVVTDSEISLTWSDNSNNELLFRLQRRVASGGG